MTVLADDTEAITTGLTPIPGRALDPPPKDLSAYREKLDDHHIAAGIGFRAFNRFVDSRAPLLAAGTTYYLFLSLISLLAFAYGVTAILGADALSDSLTESIQNAFPGLIGDSGISPEALRQSGQTASIVGLLLLFYSGTAAASAGAQALHIIYGAHRDPRNFALKRLRLAGWLLLVGPVILLAFIPSVVVTSLADPILDWLGIDGDFVRFLLVVGTILLSLLLNYAVIYLLLSVLGGIRPSKSSRRAGAALGAIAIEAIKYASAYIISWSLDKPQYGAFAIPITIMFVLFLFSLSLYAAASITAGTALKEQYEAEQAESPSQD